MIRIEERGRLIIAHFPEHPTVEVVTEFFGRMQQNLLKRQRLALVLDASAVKSSPVAVREVANRFLKENKAALTALMAGQATVLASPLIRGALTAIHFFAPPGYPTKTFAELAPAIAWAESQLGNRVQPSP
jgi:hypothetical protein